MGRKVIVFQTLKYKGTPEDIERDGPFICRWENSWMGTGYYFWETFLVNAHWWGKAHLNGNYIICEAEYTFDDEKIFDLSGGNPQHSADFDEYSKFLKKQGFIKDKVTTVSKVFQFLRTHIKGFNYEATRAYGVNSIGEILHPEHIYRMPFELQLGAYLDLRPAIQICFYTKSALNLKNYRVIYPDEFIDQYVF